MNDESVALVECADSADMIDAGDYPIPVREAPEISHMRDEESELAIPTYLEEQYWWAYLRPGSIRVFEREWLVNLILWGNMRSLSDAVLQEINGKKNGQVLQVACVYGDFSQRLARQLNSTETNFHLVDIAPIQLDNARRKLQEYSDCHICRQDSSALNFESGKFDETVVFFLLHEQPEKVRRETMAEAVRVTRPGGKVIFVDYHGPHWLNPMRYLMYPVLKWLEPFALDLWRNPLRHYLPKHIGDDQVSHQSYFGGLYQKVVVNC